MISCFRTNKKLFAFTLCFLSLFATAICILQHLFDIVKNFFSFNFIIFKRNQITFRCAISQSRQQIKSYHTFSIMSRTFFIMKIKFLLNCSNQICYILNLHYCTSSHFPAVFVRQRKLYYHTEISMSSIIPIFLQSHFSFSLCKKNIVTVQFSISYIRKLSTAAMQLSFTSFHK